MDWKDIMALLIAATLAGIGALTGRCSDSLFMICTGIVGGVFGRARSGGDSRKIHTEITAPVAPAPTQSP